MEEGRGGEQRGVVRETRFAGWRRLKVVIDYLIFFPPLFFFDNEGL